MEMLNTEKSRSFYEEAIDHVPMGVNSNYRLVLNYPLYLKRGKGSKVWDVDGNEYIDFNMAYGAMEVGYGNPLIVNEVVKTVEEGSILGFEYCKAIELAKIIKKRYNVDMVRFSSTGTEATMHSIRIARAYSRKKKIIKFEGHYHGSHDQLLVNVDPEKSMVKLPSSEGIPEEVIKNTLIAEWNNLESFEKIIRENKDIGAVIMEPIAMNMGLIPPDKDFLKGVVELSRENNITVIFDEIKTGGKSFSGASDYVEVEPDIKVIGKSIAGGLPLSVIAGKREVMSILNSGRVAHGGTFNANPLSVRAAIVTLEKILTENAFYKMKRLNRMLTRGYNDIIEDLSLEASISSLAISGTIYFHNKVPKNYSEFLNVDVEKWRNYFSKMMGRGIIPMADYDEQWTLSIAHDEKDIENHLTIAENTLKEIKSL
ncbi:aspartate aminotransferase family protein [Acidianus brierleyi]|uniref:Aspartate aminotransferase family protein n=1 Tax=Acidianus brierleyi TaxID=41673 RepID=A0A2U9ICL9_9CREN|nr:aspartate aminotransferase family protein [Acidianus brierleyi]AWR93757.1 aminotransferase class III-fold pyridoxal phosphate-dependent enzyme [Acidianus brierleyi]